MSRSSNLRVTLKLHAALGNLFMIRTNVGNLGLFNIFSDTGQKQRPEHRSFVRFPQILVLQVIKDKTDL